MLTVEAGIIKYTYIYKQFRGTDANIAALKLETEYIYFANRYYPDVNTTTAEEAIDSVDY
jgi:hypothetical protein